MTPDKRDKTQIAAIGIGSLRFGSKAGIADEELQHQAGNSSETRFEILPLHSNSGVKYESAPWVRGHFDYLLTVSSVFNGYAQCSLVTAFHADRNFVVPGDCGIRRELDTEQANRY